MSERTMDKKHDNRHFDEAADWFMRLQSAGADDDLWSELDDWLTESPDHAAAYREVESAWGVVASQAAAPEVMVMRRNALERGRRAAQSRWSGKNKVLTRRVMAAAASVLVALVWWRVEREGNPEPQRYTTTTGEQRIITLEDNSKIALDARSQIAVTYSERSRSIELIAGQAYFDVSTEPNRPFKVRVSGHAVVALGTAFNIEMVSRDVLVTLVDGRVAVLGDEARNKNDQRVKTQYSEMSPGQQLLISRLGSVELREDVNVQKVTAWRNGKLVFVNEPLANAVTRMNRYSHTKIVVLDKSISATGVSGVFNSGDTRAFVEALESFFPIRSYSTDKNVINLVADKKQTESR